MATSEQSPASRSRLRTVAFRLALLSGGLSAGLAIAIGALVALDWATLREDIDSARTNDAAWHDPNTRFDSEIGWVPIASSRVQKDWGTISTNAAAFRSPEPRPGATSVAILGDSVTWGYGVDGSVPFASKLDAQLQARGAQAFNLGVSGYGIGQSVLWFERSADSLPQLSDVVLAVCAQNDVADTQMNARYGRRKPLFRLQADAPERLVTEATPIRRLSLRHAYTDSRFLRGALSRIPGADAFVRNRMGDVQLDRTETDAVIGLLLQRLRASVEARGAQLHVLLLPSRDDLVAETDDYRLLRDRSLAAGLPLIEVVGALRATRRIPRGVQRSAYLYLDEMHLQPYAHTVVAAELERGLRLRTR